jgi:NAD(P)-dependent dehydrogenase (short-subunit alcohol dehydrogenase family)
MMIRMLATEEVNNGIRANAVGPGVVEGGMVPPMRADEQTKNLLDSAVAVTPMGRLGLVEEIAEAVAFLASAKASYITGQRLMVDGGLAT